MLRYSLCVTAFALLFGMGSTFARAADSAPPASSSVMVGAGHIHGAHHGHGHRRRAARWWRAAFPYGVVTPHAANPYANPYVDVRYWYPRYYGGLHYREFHRFGYPTGDYPIRGTAW